jgi:hypothetical protein
MTADEIKAACGYNPEEIPEDKWEFVSKDPHGEFVKERFWVNPPRGEFPGVFIERKRNLNEKFLFEVNRKQYDTEQKFSRKGELDAKVASVPLNTLFNDKNLLEGVQGDRDKLKWWLNNDENRVFRTIKGKI